MSFDAEKLFALLPAIHQIRDTELAAELSGQLTANEQAELDLLRSRSQLTKAEAKRLGELEEKLQRGPLKALLTVIAEQVAALEENLDQLYDDQFIETCANWVVPYIGDLVGTRGTFVFPNAEFSERAFVANTLSYRRRKGTAAILEQLARDVTGWNANVVEYFLRLATTQYLNHIRPDHLSVADLEDWEALESINTPFDKVPRNVDVRRIESRRGRHNIPNIGVFLWRLGAYRITAAPAFRLDSRRYLFDALGKNTRLFGQPKTEEQITHLAEPTNVPLPLSRRPLDNDLASYYGFDEDQNLQSILLNVDGFDVVPPSSGTQTSPPAPQLSDLISVCNLSDDIDSNGNVIGWIHMPQEKIAIDPKLGRIAFPTAPTRVRVTYHYGFSANMGGGEYGRVESFSTVEEVVSVPRDAPDIEAGLAALLAAFVSDPSIERGAVEIERPEVPDQDHYYVLGGPINIPAGKFIELRSADEYRPVVLLDDDLVVTGGAESELSLNGLLISGHGLHVPNLDGSNNQNELSRLSITHCTVVPGETPAITLSELSPPVVLPAEPSAPRLFLEAANATLAVDHSIVGGIRAVSGGQVIIHNSIVDATSETGVAYGDPLAGLTTSPPESFGSLNPGAPLEVVNTTIIGKVHTLMMRLASNTIFFAGLAQNDSWPSPVRAERLQQGCVRFSYVPPGSQLPRLFNCQPAPGSDAAGARPVFTSQRYGEPGYCQLSPHSPATIRSGADDQAEMGAFHDLYEPQRESNLRASLDEYLRFGLEVGILYAT